MKNVINRALVAKKKIFLTFMLAIVSSLWIMSEAACIPAGIAAMDPITIIQISGTIQWLGYPCEENEVCPPCLTPAIVTSDKTYYLSTSNPEMQEFLEHMESTPVPSMYLLPLQATASGIPYTRGSYDFLTVNNIYDLYVQYFSDQLPRINSLCDEWHVLHEPFECMGPYCYLETDIYRLKGDTGISIFIDMPEKYYKLEKNGQYIGALDEGNNRDIYYVPANSQNAYLLYAFNAQVGDTLSNLWVGGFGRDYQGVVQAISNGSPRIFTIGVKFGDESDDYLYPIRWIEGVGSPETPMGMAVVPDVPADIGVYTLLCAYKNGEQVYTSEMGEKYGCEYNYDPSQPMFPSDTRWHYEHSEMYGGPNDNYNFTIQPADIIINNTRYQQISGFPFRSSGAKVWCALDSAGTLVERLVYDFDLQVGDSIPTYYGSIYDVFEDPYDHSYAKVTNVEHIYLADGRPARRISYDYRPDDIEHIGSVEGILAPLYLPIPTCGCADHFRCCTYAGTLLYEVAKGACDTFFVNLQPTDTIPLYIRDDSGTSTVDPVDPNQIYATLTGNELAIHNNTGANVTITMNTKTANNIAAKARKNTEPITFTESISIELTEDGVYEIWLTSEEWNYSIFGTFNHVRSATPTTKQDQPLTTKKILRGTQILIERGDKTYTLTGQEVK